MSEIEQAEPTPLWRLFLYKLLFRVWMLREGTSIEFRMLWRWQRPPGKGWESARILWWS
ncbi:MAG: hypothetical protein ACRCZI_11195 [Cetobacterium sp.]